MIHERNLKKSFCFFPERILAAGPPCLNKHIDTQISIHIIVVCIQDTVYVPKWALQKLLRQTYEHLIL